MGAIRCLNHGKPQERLTERQKKRKRAVGETSWRGRQPAAVPEAAPGGAERRGGRRSATSPSTPSTSTCS